MKHPVKGKTIFTLHEKWLRLYQVISWWSFEAICDIVAEWCMQLEILVSSGQVICLMMCWRKEVFQMTEIY